MFIIIVNEIVDVGIVCDFMEVFVFVILVFVYYNLLLWEEGVDVSFDLDIGIDGGIGYLGYFNVGILLFVVVFVWELGS